MTEQEFTAQCVLNTNVLLNFLQSGSIAFEDAIRQLHHWTKDCPQARSLVPAESPAARRLQELDADREMRGVDLFAIEHIGIVLYRTVGGHLETWLIGVTSLGETTVSVEVGGKSGQVYITNTGLQSFSNLEKQVIEIATRWPGDHIDPSASSGQTDCSVYINSGSGERCVVRWVFGTTSEQPPQEMQNLISSAVALANRVVASGGPKSGN